MPSQPKAPLNRKPAACKNCSLYERGHGFVPPDGPANAPLAMVGEAPGYSEVEIGRPFVGAAGSMLERILRRNGLTRQQFRVGNILQCCPPGLELHNAPYEFSAIDHCAVHRDPLLAEGHQVILAMGATPIKTLLHLHGHSRIRVEEFHGTVHRDPGDHHWIVPTFHPSFLQRGATNLIGTVSFDLQVALELARGQWRPEPIDLVIDPPTDWFAAWTAQVVAAATQDPDGVALSCDVETPDKAGGKPENELTPDDQSYQILRWNFSCHPDQGITVPDDPAYWPYIQQLLALACWHYWWNGYGYDWARIAARGAQPAWGWQIDLMVAAHILQSDVPLGLGFWAPFYSRYGAWKHLSETDPAKYACIDGPQTQRCGYGIIGDLIQQGQWRAFLEDCHQLYHNILKPAQDVGILIDRPELDRFHEDLAVKQRRLLHELQAHVPDELRPLTGETSRPPQAGVLHPAARTTNLRTGEPLAAQPDPLKQDLFALSATRVERVVKRIISCCSACGQMEVHTKHRCKGPDGKPLKGVEARLEIREVEIPRWFWQEPFNPDSAPQVLAYLKYRGHKPGKDKHTHKDSANRDTLLRLWKTTRDPFYKSLLDYRAVKKVDSTYAVPTIRKVAQEVEAGREPRIHPIVTFRPSMGRLSYVAPNITNIVADKTGKQSLAAGFRRCVVAGPGCRLLEVDFASAEPTEVGWLIRDPHYLRLARLGAHAYITSHLLKRPADLRWSDEDLGAYLREVKHDPQNVLIYDKTKRANNGINYGLTAFGMAETFPDIYKDQADAQKIVDLIYSLFPNLPTFHYAVQQRAYDAGYLGGPGPAMMAPTVDCYKRNGRGEFLDTTPFNHPFQYRHWFWSVLAYKPISEKQRQWREKRRRVSVEIGGRWFAVDRGEDAKRVIAWGPQSIAAGVLKRAMRMLFAHPDHPSYIGDCYFGRTPLRAPIHDSLLLEVPDRMWDRVVEAVAREMQRPILEQPLPAEWGMGEYLAIGADAKVGKNWKDTEGLALPLFAEVGTEGESWPVEEIDQEDFEEMGTVA